MWSTLAVCLGLMGGDAPGSQRLTAPAIGASVPDFSLHDIHRRTRSLGQYSAKAFVVVFVGTECPLANLYIPTLVALHSEYHDDGIQIIAINSNAQDRFVEVSAHAQERDVPFPVLKDFDARVADSFGAKRTPEAFLIDANRVIRYHGRIDDQYGIGYHRDSPSATELKNAIEDVLAGRDVGVRESPLAGCFIARTRQPRIRRELTYAKDVAPIVQNRCQSCHRPGEIGPMALLTYDDIKQWSETIHEVVLQQRMPPWHPDPRFGKFSNDRRLTERERDTILDWVEQGCVKGSESDLPPPRQFTSGWSIGEPDLIVEMPEEFSVPATGTVPYKRFVVDPGFEQDRWFQAAEARPGNRAVVHHIVVYVQVPGQPVYQRDGTASILSGWAPGDLPYSYPSGTAKRIPAGSKLIFEMHYTPNGTPQTDRSRVGVVFAKGAPEHVAETNILANYLFKIPAGAARHAGRAQYTFRDDARILGFMPHMHLRGLSARYELTRPDGSTETLLNVPDYDFNWQSVYRFAEPVRVTKGSRITWTAVWDNSADNPRNPDATREVRWGEQTWDEMMNGWMDLVWEKSVQAPDAADE